MSTSLFNTSTSTPSISPKVHVSYAELSPKYLDPSQPPTKGVPFRQINDISFVKDVRICMPKWLHESLYSDKASNGTSRRDGDLLPQLRYAKANMTLKDLLDNEDLRRGNCLLLSTSGPPTSNSTTISLNRGNLTITMPHHTHQRAGLTFPTSKVSSGGRKHDSRSMQYRVETDLRQPSMVKGKKGFDRLMYAARNVEGLKEARVWLFYDLSDQDKVDASSGKKRKRDKGETETATKTDEIRPTTTTNHSNELTPVDPATQIHPLSKFNSTITITPSTTSHSPNVLLPSFLTTPSFFPSLSPQTSNQSSQRANIPTILEEDIYDAIEYLSLLFLQSPRITKAGYQKVDPYLCQYTMPDVSSSPSPPQPTTENNDTNPSHPVNNEDHNIQVEDLSITSYTGFMAPSFAINLLIDLIRRSRFWSRSQSQSQSPKTPQIPSTAWVAINIIAHPTEVNSGGSGSSSASPDGLIILLQTDDTDASSTDEDTTMTEGAASTNETGAEQSKDRRPNGFRHVTCFEFSDSTTG